MLRRLLYISLVFLSLMALSGCDFRTTPAIVTQVITLPPTNTLAASMYSMTPKFTATPIPTVTPIPSITETPAPTEPPISPTPSITPTPTQAVVGAVGFANPTVNLRSGPGSTFSIVEGLKAGTKLVILGWDTSKQWYNVRVEVDSKEGWLLANLVSASGTDSVPTLSTPYFDTQTAVAASQVPSAGTQEAGTSVQPGATRRPGLVTKSDVLAYCDNKSNGQPRKTIPQGTPVTVYWSWFAKQPTQLQDQIDYGQYKVTVDGQELTDWRNFKTDVIKLADGNYYVFWYVPIGTPTTGDHQIVYNLTWTQQISDGYKTYGPNGDQQVDNGTCTFTVK